MRNKHESGEIITYLSIAVLIVLTFFSLASSKLISQKQTSTTKAQECSCGCAYTETQCTGGYSYVAIAWDEYDTPTQYDYVCQGWEDVCTTCNQCPEQEPVNYDSESSSSESTNYDWESSSSESEYDQTSYSSSSDDNITPDEYCSVGDCYLSSELSMGGCSGEYEQSGTCRQNGENGVCCKKIEQANLPNQSCESDSECFLNYESMDQGQYQTSCDGSYVQTGSCRENNIEGVCCKKNEEKGVVKVNGQDIPEGQDVGFGDIVINAQVDQTYQENYTETNPADVQLSATGNGEYSVDCESGVSLNATTNQEYELLDENGNVIQRGNSFNLCN